MSLRESLNFQDDPVYLIDGTGLFYRAFYARADLTRSDGFPTNAINTTLRTLVNLLKDERPKYVGFIMDGKGPTFRHEMYDLYKAQRPGMPEPLAQQIDPVRAGVELLGIKLLVSDGVEADDLICALADKFKHERPVIILASDKDLKQCLDTNVAMVSQAGPRTKINTLASFREEEGLEPDQWPDFQAMIGDSADNIPGIPKVGPVTARKIMADFPTLEALREGYQALPDKLREKVEPELENVFLYRELTRMKRDCCDHHTLDEFSVNQPDVEGLRAFYEEYELRALARSLPKGSKVAKPAPAAAPVSASGGAKSAVVQGSLFGDDSKEDSAEPMDLKHAPLADLPDVAGRVIGLVVDETAGEPRFFLGIDGKEYRCPATHGELAGALKSAKMVATPSVQDLLRADHAWKSLASAQWFDLSLAAYLLDPEARNYTWPRLKQSLYQDGRPEFDGVSQGLHPDAMGLAALAYMNGVRPKVEGAGLLDLMRDLELPLIPVLTDMERAGIAIDTTAFDAYLSEVSGQLDGLSRAIIEKAGHEFNIRSSQQLAVVLFDELDIKPGGKTPGGQLSTANQVLEKIRTQHPIVEDILEFRMLEKLRSTYLEPLPKMADEHGRLHTHFNQLTTATGRLSSSGPNLQNIPIRGPHGKRMRACFAAEPGNLLVGADYSQIELRVLAHFSGDPNLVQAFERDEDIHSRTAALLHDKDPADVTREERNGAKTINFGLIYGMGPQKLARELSITQNQAKEFIARYFEKLSTLKAFYEEIVENAQASGYVTTLAGRRRLLPELHSRNSQMVSQARRQAVNTVIQGSAADIIKMAMIAAHRDDALAATGSRLILQVHDELLLEVPEQGAEQAGARLKEIMQTVAALKVPLKVDMGVGPTWAIAH